MLRKKLGPMYKLFIFSLGTNEYIILGSLIYILKCIIIIHVQVFHKQKPIHTQFVENYSPLQWFQTLFSRIGTVYSSAIQANQMWSKHFFSIFEIPLQ